MTIIITIGLISAVLLVLLKGPFIALGVSIPLTIAAALQLKRWEYRKKLSWYGDRIENIYEFQQSPTDKGVIERAKEHDKWIELSGNEMDVKVVCFFFQDSLNPSETWDDYMHTRVPAGIAADRQIRHQHIEKEYGREYYLREMHGQRGIVYEEELSTDQPKKHALLFPARELLQRAGRLWHQLSRSPQ